MILLPAHFEYIKFQHGKVGAFIDDFTEWKYQYERSLQSIYDSFKNHLPHKINSALDIGGGFSGISTLVKPDFLTVIDGINEPAQYGGLSNDELLAKEFLALNGVFNAEYVHPENAHKIDKKYDVIYSFASYPFHMKADVYAENLVKNSHENTVFIFEVRRGFDLPLKIVKVLHEAEKYERVLAVRL